jgi:hypothetical protein
MLSKDWNKLLEFESRDLIERYILVRHGRRASARQVLEISSNFIQGREYFRNAENAAITVKPLLQYYGVTALARGLILACSPRTSEASMKPSHGLDTVNWQKSLATKDYGDLTASIKKGTFLELMQATENRAYFKHNTSAIDWHIDYTIPPEGFNFTFLDVIQTLPDLEDEFEIWKNMKMDTVVVSGFNRIGDDNFEFIINPARKNENAVRNLFPQEIVGEYEIIDDKHLQTIRTKQNYFPHFSQKFLFPLSSELRQIKLTKPIKYIIHLSPIGQLYTMAFFLGMLSRYFPSIWIGLGRTERGDAIFPLISKSIDLIDTYFPSVVWEFLNAASQDE